jgi:hypothetical protein
MMMHLVYKGEVHLAEVIKATPDGKILHHDLA